MTAFGKCKMNSEKGKMKAVLGALFIVNFSLFAGAGCQQRMAEQPYHRPYEPSAFYEDGRSARPLERGVIHRSQHLESDPYVTGLTREEWGRIYARGDQPKVDLGKPTPIENKEIALGMPRYDQRDAGNPKVYVEEFPFEITSDDLARGQDRFTIYCAVCHGPLGNGQGKIWERGYLNPTSFHTEIVGAREAPVAHAPKTPLGFSRGYAMWDVEIPMRDVPVGYIFEVITKGFGGMPSYSAQIPPADRWRIAAYVRALQHSQHATAPAGGKK
jgi:mono/diheme cytochrome c family protein